MNEKELTVDEQIRKFCLEQAVIVHSRLSSFMGSPDGSVGIMEIADKFYSYIKAGKVDDPACTKRK